MAELQGKWKRVNGERFFIVIRDGWLFRKVLLRDGKYSYLDETLEESTVFKPTGKSLEKQLMETIDRHVGTRDRRNEVINRACKKMNEVYDDDW